MSKLFYFIKWHWIIWIWRKWVIFIWFHLIMASVGQNGPIAQGPDEKSYVSFTLAVRDFQSLSLLNAPWKSVLTFLSQQHQSEIFAVCGRLKNWPLLFSHPVSVRGCDCLQLSIPAPVQGSDSNPYLKHGRFMSQNWMRWARQGSPRWLEP